MISAVIIQIAKQTRQDIIKLVQENRFEVDCFSLDELDCMCNIASRHFSNLLIKQKIKNDFVVGEYKGDNHCWVEIKDTIIDLTAKQFICSASDIHIIKVGSDKNYISRYKNKSAIEYTQKWIKSQRYETFESRLNQ